MSLFKLGCGWLILCCLSFCCVQAQVLDKHKLWHAETFWDNRDFDWYAENIPFFECPDQDITTTYYYRWDLLTKHLTYGSPASGYSFTEFIDRPFWSGAYGAISCPAGHQLYEARWLRGPRIANDYSRYWLRTPGAQPRNYSTWLADAVWAVHQVHPDRDFVIDLLKDLDNNYQGWEARHFDPPVGLFWQTGHDDGMEFNINSRQTQDILRGAPSYRPSFNAYMWADAQAIARIAQLANKPEVAEKYRRKAEALREKMIELMWDEKRQFFFPVLKNDEHRDGHHLKALTRTYESGQYAGDPHGRELIGYVPWQFNMFAQPVPTASGVKDPRQFEVAWKKLMDRDGFFADFGPSTVERNDPMFLLKNSCCWWSGQSWPYATTQTLKGLAHLLQHNQETLTIADYNRLLSIYARSHRKDGRPYLAEALHPDTGSFEGHDGYNHSEHYFHSGYCDLVITGLAGLVPRDDDTLEIHSLAPPEWDYFAVEQVPYRGRLLSIVWDKTGQRYGLGQGLHVLVDGVKAGSSPTLARLAIKHAVPEPEPAPKTSKVSRVNYVVNNDGAYFPRVTASHTSANSSLAKVNDGNYWYLLHPPNRWTCEGTNNREDWIEVDFGTPRTIDEIKAYVLDDSRDRSTRVRAPKTFRAEIWQAGQWKTIDGGVVSEIQGHKPVKIAIRPVEAQRLRFTLEHSQAGPAGLTELEVWGNASLPLVEPPHPPGNLAYNSGKNEFPKTSASFQDRFGGEPKKAIDGITNFLPTPMNRWTSYESPGKEDWLEIDFGKPVQFRRVEMAIYDDRGGVQAPESYRLAFWKNDSWVSVEELATTPATPAGSQWNTARFKPVESPRLRIYFTNRGQARSGVTEVMVWNE